MKNNLLIFAFPLLITFLWKVEKPATESCDELNMEHSIDFAVLQINSTNIDYRWTITSATGATSSGNEIAGYILNKTFELNDEIEFYAVGKEAVKIKFISASAWPNKMVIYLKAASDQCSESKKQRVWGNFYRGVSTSAVIRNTQRSPDLVLLTSASSRYDKCFTLEDEHLNLEYTSIDRGSCEIEIEAPKDSDTKIDVAMDDTTPFPFKKKKVKRAPLKN
jgi:hypothetical protein